MFISTLTSLMLGLPQPEMPAQCHEPSTAIAAVQTNAAASPLQDQQVIVQGVVTASWTASKQLGGFFIQAALPDADPETSEGLFIESSTYQVEPGELVRLTGVVSENEQMTRLREVELLSRCGKQALPAAVTLDLPLQNQAWLESVEGMRVTIKQPTVVNGHYQLARHGQFDIAHQRLYSPTQVAKPGAAAQALAEQNRQALLTVDDAQAPNPAVIPYPPAGLSANNTLRSGDWVQPFTAIVTEYEGRYRLQPLQPLVLTERNPRPAAPVRLSENDVRIAAFNVLNYFNGEGESKTFPTDRGAKNAAQFKLQHEKIIAALTALDADVIGLMEIENDGTGAQSAIVELTTALQTSTGHAWQFIDTGTAGFGDDSITNALIYRSDKVEPQGEFITTFAYPFNQRSRLPLIQVFRDKRSGEQFSVAVNHFKSKGSCPGDADPSNHRQGDGQGCWNPVRVKSAQQLLATLSSSERLQQLEYHIVLGDLNAYAQEDPLTTLAQAGFVNLIEQFEPNGYSYVFASQAGSLDHILVNQPLAAKVRQLKHWAINADEPIALQYQALDKYPDRVDTSPYRASDHDPLYLDLKF